jgi:hypothetical protein
MQVCISTAQSLMAGEQLPAAAGRGGKNRQCRTLSYDESRGGMLESIEQSSISSEPVANVRGILRWLQDISTSQE